MDQPAKDVLKRNARPAPFWHDASGTSALEFALVASPFILLLLAVLEVGVVFFANSSLENAVAQGARLIRTGQMQNQGFDANQFKTEVCKHIYAPISCSGLKLDVQNFSSFSTAGSGLTSPLDAAGNLKPNFNYNPGVGGDVVVVRGFYDWGITARFPKEIGLGNMASGDRFLVATAVFRNEPFQPPQ